MMQELWRLTSSPRNLMVFEAAARLGSFTRAAQELNVQQPAISAAIKQLEAALGVTLFLREHRKISLTAAGQRLYSDVSMAFDQITQSAKAVRQLGGREYVTLNASSAFNFYWMMPRLSALHDRYPHIDLRLQTSDREPDIDAENISLAVRRGDGNWPDVHAVLLAPERISPVASPRVMATAVTMRSLPSLLHQRLIELEEPIRKRPRWRDYFAHFGITETYPKTGLRLNDYALVLQAAMAGEGFAFGWEHVTQGLIQQNLLQARKDWGWDTGLGFYLVWSKKRELSVNAAQTRDWIIQAV